MVTAEAMAASPPDRIETARLVLRRPVYADGPALHALLSDPIVCRFSPHPLLTDLAVTRFVIADWNERRAEGLRTFMIAYADRRREPLGFISVTAEREVAGLLSPREAGRGIATEALRGVIDALALRDAWTLIDAEHLALIQTLAKVGFTPERRLPAHRVHPQISAQKRDCVLLRQQSARDG